MRSFVIHMLWPFSQAALPIKGCCQQWARSAQLVDLFRKTIDFPHRSADLLRYKKERVRKMGSISFWKSIPHLAIRMLLRKKFGPIVIPICDSYFALCVSRSIDEHTKDFHYVHQTIITKVHYNNIRQNKVITTLLKGGENF